MTTSVAVTQPWLQPELNDDNNETGDFETVVRDTRVTFMATGVWYTTPTQVLPALLKLNERIDAAHNMLHLHSTPNLQLLK